MRVIPFRRQLRIGTVGRDVQAVKRGLARSGHGDLKWAAASGPAFGPRARARLMQFQRQQLLDADGVYGLASHRALAPFFDDYAYWLYTGQKPGMSTRDKIVAAALYFHAIRDRVHYTQGPGRMSIVRNKLKPPVQAVQQVFEDCSSFATGVYWIAGADDPNGRGYDGFGFTGTLCQHGKAVPLALARPGDLAFYGPAAPWKHVIVLAGPARGISHGSEPGPFLVEPHYRPDLGQVRSYLP